MQSLSGGSEHANPRDIVEEERCRHLKARLGGSCRENGGLSLSSEKLMGFKEEVEVVMGSNVHFKEIILAAVQA